VHGGAGGHAGRQYANDSLAITFDPTAPANATSTTVQAGATHATITGAKGLTSVDCPSALKGVAVDGAGNAFVQAPHGEHRRGHRGQAADRHRRRGRHRR
jgi:hypothetical protein